MKKLLNKITDMPADAALLEMGVQVITPLAQAGTPRETLEENFIEIAFAEAADYDDIHNAILREHRSERDIAHPMNAGTAATICVSYRRAAVKKLHLN